MDGFFLGANTPGGFYSLYESELKQCTVKYILKGSPGCGKSTLMKTVCAALEQNGRQCEKIYCSSDPKSLDAVICGNVCIVDGTSPHVAEPEYACANEYYVNLGDCCRESIGSDRDKIVKLTDAYRSEYALAYPLLSAAGKLRQQRLETAGSITEDFSKRAFGISSREFGRIKHSVNRGTVKRRFLSSICHEGIIERFHHAVTLCPKVYEIKTDHALGAKLLDKLKTAALCAGHDILLCPSPMDPEGDAVHLLIPSLKLCFLTTDRYTRLPITPYKRILADRYMDKAALAEKRCEVRRLKKTENELVSQAVAHLKKAFTLHDELEAAYKPHMNFDEVSARAQVIIGEILEMKQF